MDDVLCRYFFLLLAATLPLGCCTKGQESRVRHHSAGGKRDGEVSYGFWCPSYAACWKVFSFIFGLDSESFSVQLTFADF